MVGDNARCGIGVEVLTGNERRMAVNLLGRRLVGSIDAGAGLGVGHKDARQVHHFAQTKDIAWMLGKKRLHIGSRNNGTGLLVGCRYAGRYHKEDIQREIFGCLHHIGNTVTAGNIGNLVAVGNGSGSTARRGHASILGGTDVRRLDMQMPVNKTGSEIATLAVDDLSCLVGASGIVATIVEHADDYTVLDGNATGRHTLAIHVDNLRIGKQRVDGHAALGGLDHRPHDLNGHTYSFNRRKKLRSGQTFTAANQ